MARPASQSLSQPAELRATKGALDQRWIELKGVIAAALELDPRELRVDADYQSDRVWAGLQGAACERVTRDQGGANWVAPLCEMPSNLLAWLGWQEAWELTTGQRPYRFKNMGLTVYLGKRHEAIKPQFLRLEWPGITKWGGPEVSFQSPGAGHPHWQIDLMRSLAQDRPVDFQPDPVEIVEDFETALQEPTANDLVRRLSIERMHLASAAPWWLPAPSGDVGHHINAPRDLPALSRWLNHSLLYLRQELARCVVHA
ncbi:hypothetical protein V5F32_18735 [Xanthobacter oligotrophicus]|uniref:Uncharacterized protein n=1 Tax=Xanthobacter oligotrophicus TaxID=2607286 RepID=A0ABW7A2J7_9HYPH